MRVGVFLRNSQDAPHRGEPLTCGFPVPRAALASPGGFRWSDPDLADQPVDTRTLMRWPDGSPRWILATFLADLDAHARERRTLVWEPGFSPTPRRVDSAVGPRFRTSLAEGPFRLAPSSWGGAGPRLSFSDARGACRKADPIPVGVIHDGPVFRRIRWTASLGRWHPLELVGVFDLYAGGSLIRMEISVTNPRRARRRGNCWDLGDPASLSFRDLSVEWTLGSDARTLVSVRSELDAPFRFATGGFGLHQESSGGSQWRSRNHIDRTGVVPLRYSGYRAWTGSDEWQGERSSPTVRLERGRSRFESGLTDFWQNFPNAVEADESSLRWRLFPATSETLHELQPGERKTHELWFRLGDVHEPVGGLDWIHAPAYARVDATTTSATSWMETPCENRRPQLDRQIEASLGAEGFFFKRERVDEYGWRNFGDLWADHEQVYSKAPAPIVSHYNNQYDPLESFLLLWLETGDPRWRSLADPLARHATDIDRYHARHEKTAYAGGPFWHTDHYHDAGTSTHRAFSKAMGGSSGGPSVEHDYTNGLLLFHLLTGDEAAREAVIGFAEWILAIDDGRGHLLGVVSEEPTGLASCTREPTYHGPGRGAGNSINTLLNAWVLTGQERYVAFAEELIRRTIHFEDDPGRHELQDFERRWTYTVELLALDRYRRFSLEAGREGPMPTYAALCLLRYADWMVENERYFLDHVDELEYPTETWAAQELRKGLAVLAAALVATGERRQRFRKWSKERSDRSWNQLLEFPTSSRTRPLVLSLRLGLAEERLEQRWRTEREADALDLPDIPRTEFVPQRTIVRGAVRSPIHLARFALRALNPMRWAGVLRRSWLAQRTRMLVGAFADRAERSVTSRRRKSDLPEIETESTRSVVADTRARIGSENATRERLEGS